MKSGTVLLILLTAVAVTVLVYVTIKTMQRIGFDKIRESVYKAFVVAENRFQHGENDAKFCYVVNVAKEVIPSPFSLFITEQLLKEMIQVWFDLCKDILDDGRMNGTECEEKIEQEDSEDE